MTLDQILIFSTIAKSGSLGAAAKALHRTQPTLSVALKKLEDELGLELFTREHYRIRLTPAGQGLLKKADYLLSQAEEFSTLGQYFATGYETELRVALDPLIAIDPILQVLKGFEQRYCKTQLTLVSQYLSGGSEKLFKEEVDLAFVIWPINHQEFEYLETSKLNMQMVISPHFPLFGKKLYSLNEMRNQAQIIIKDSAASPTKDQFNTLKEGRQWFVTDAQTKKEIILAGMGWGSLPAHFIQKELASGELLEIEVESLPNRGDIPVYLSKKKGKHLGPVAQELWNEFGG